MNIGLYIHIPFCQQKCMYCDFPSYTGFSHLYSDYTAALCREISGWGGILSDMQLDTLYIGGGTPTLLPTVQLERILQCVRDNFSLAENGEYSIEANPGTLDNEKINAHNYANYNFCKQLQSMNDRLCKQIRIFL